MTADNDRADRINRIVEWLESLGDFAERIERHRHARVEFIVDNHITADEFCDQRWQTAFALHCPEAML